MNRSISALFPGVRMQCFARLRRRFSLVSATVAPALLALALFAPAVVAPLPLAAQSAGSAQGAIRAARAMRPGDGVRIRIFLEPELSGEFLVDERGIVVIPKLGEYAVGNLPADSVRPQLLTAFKKFLVTDAIEITPFRRVAVSGAVLKPGLYPVDPSMSVGDAIILAGGVAPNGNRDHVQVRFTGAAKGTTVRGERLVWDTDAGGARQLHVTQRPWIVRNFQAVTSLSLSVISVYVTAITVAILLARVE